MPTIRSLTRQLVWPVAFAFAALAFAAAAPAQELQEGKQYVRVKNPAPPADLGKKIEVIEFFSYGCPHCADLEPEMQSWLKTLPPDVQFRRVPVMFQDRWVALAKIYYTLDALGEEKRLSPEVFSALHSRGVSLWQDKTFFDWAASQGLDRKKVEDLYNSFTIVGKVNRAKQMGQAYNIQSVPTMVIDGKYATGPERLQGGHATVPIAVDALIAKARAERPKS